MYVTTCRYVTPVFDKFRFNMCALARNGVYNNVGKVQYVFYVGKMYTCTAVYNGSLVSIHG